MAYADPEQKRTSDKQYRLENKAKIRIRQKAYLTKNRERERLRSAARYAADPETHKARNHASYLKHKEERNRRSKEYRLKNWDRLKDLQYFNYLFRKYGLTKARYFEMWEEQKGICALCPRVFDMNRSTCMTTPHVDHDHATGKVRAFLCQICNTSLGRFENDPDFLQRAVAYVNTHK